MFSDNTEKGINSIFTDCVILTHIATDVNNQNGDIIKEDNNSQTRPVNTDNMVNTANLHDHLNAMEQRLSCSITNNVTANVTHNLQGTINSFDSTLRTAMESMTSAVTRLIESNEAMIKHKETMDGLTQENRTLTTRKKTNSTKLRTKN